MSQLFDENLIFLEGKLPSWMSTIELGLLTVYKYLKALSKLYALMCRNIGAIPAIINQLEL